MLNGGIIQYFLSLEHEMLISNNVPDAIDGLQILSLDDLSFGFVFWLGSCAVSSTIFLIEVLKFKLQLKKKIKTLIGLMFFLKLLQIRLKLFIL
jgi:hypothetical protein